MTAIGHSVLFFLSCFYIYSPLLGLQSANAPCLMGRGVGEVAFLEKPLFLCTTMPGSVCAHVKPCVCALKCFRFVAKWNRRGREFLMLSAPAPVQVGPFSRLLAAL